MANTSLFNPGQWERVSRAQVRLALQLALHQSWVTWRTAGELALGRRPSILPPRDDGAAGGSDSGSNDGLAPSPDAPPLLTSADARRAALLAARRAGAAADAVVGLARDEALRARLVALGSETLTLARDALDELLLGYEEGKHAEVRAFLEDSAAKEAEVLARMQRLRGDVAAAERESRSRGGGGGGSGGVAVSSSVGVETCSSGREETNSGGGMAVASSGGAGNSEGGALCAPPGGGSIDGRGSPGATHVAAGDAPGIGAALEGGSRSLRGGGE